MPHNNGASRSAVKVTVPKEQHIKDLQKKALNLEERLANCKGISSSNDARGAGQQQVNLLRMNLCEALSDILLTDPATAAATDCVGRLWRNCFYARIGPQRTRLAKDKRKAAKTGGNNGEPDKKLTRSIAGQEENLQLFLAEGVTLYGYLCDKLQYKLVGGEEEDDESQTQDSMMMISSTMGGDEASTTLMDGVVPCLHRLYIHLGDLYRYSSQFPKAEKAYWTAARLGPAYGHAYNQLAVVSQVKEAGSNASAAVSVYWYNRALGASQEPFPTAATNLQRLYSSNREWLQKHHGGGAAAVDSGVVLAGNASRLFLAQFVDLQFHLSSSSTGVVTDAFYNRLGETTESFRQLLQASAFGDSLLCKLVTIMAFSEVGKVNDAFVAARTATLELGQCLADRVNTILENKLSSSKGQQQQTSPPSVRVLLPLLLLTEYLLANKDIPCNEERYENAVSAFWKSIVQIFNQLQPFSQPPDEDDKPLKEYQMLRGFAPFESFLKEGDDSVTETGHLSDTVAAELLEVDTEGGSNSQQSGTQESLVRNSQASGSNLSNSTSTQEGAGRIKIHRFVALRPKLLAVSSNIRVSVSNNSLEWIESDYVDERNDGGDAIVRMNDDDNGDAFDHDNSVVMDDDEGDNGDVLVYKQGGEGGPALLVPGALLQSRTSETSSSKMTDGASLTPGYGVPGTAVDIVQPEQLQQPPNAAANVVLHGFIAGQQPIGGQQQYPAPMQYNSLQNPAQQGNGPVLPPPGFANQVAQQSAPLPPGLQNDNLGFSTTDTAVSRIPTIGESYDLFGGPESLQTANPFATDTIPSLPSARDLHPLSAQEAQLHMDLAFLQNDAANLDGARLLDSSLLNSLLMDDNSGKPSTKNPFAT